jgi:hypothetical protein
MSTLIFNFWIANLNNSTQSCDDINECLEQPLICNPTRDCKNTIGSYYCTCKSGYVPDATSDTCTNINECVATTNLCNSNTTCIDTIGSYICKCKFNYEKINDTCLYKERCMTLFFSFFQKFINSILLNLQQPPCYSSNRAMKAYRVRLLRIII